MVFTNKYTQALMSRLDKFAKSKSLKEEVELFCDDGRVSIYTIFNTLTSYIVDELICKNDKVTEEEIMIYQYVEEMRVKFSGFPEDSDEFDFDNAVCTCFLENLLNIASWKRIEYKRFIPYLGKKSREYCKAWDQFTGVRSPGLWSDQEWEESERTELPKRIERSKNAKPGPFDKM